QEQINKLFDEWTTDAKKVRATQKDKLALEVDAPRNPPAGAPISVQVNVPNLIVEAPTRTAPSATVKAKAAAGARGQITVWDKDNKKSLYQMELQNLQKTNSIKLPPQQFMKDNEYAIIVDAIGPDGKLLAREESSLS